MVQLQAIIFFACWAFTLNIWTPWLLTILIQKLEQMHFTMVHSAVDVAISGSVDPDQMLHSVVLHLDLHSFRTVCMNIWNK